MSDQLHELLDFAEHTFTVRLTGTELVALLVTIELACRHPQFRGPHRILVEQLSNHLRTLARESAPRFELLQGVVELGWVDPLPNYSAGDPPRP